MTRREQFSLSPSQEQAAQSFMANPVFNAAQHAQRTYGPIIGPALR